MLEAVKSELAGSGKSYVGYEYKEVTVNRKLTQVMTDGYAAFGWTDEGEALTLGNPMQVTLKFKRDRRNRGNAELTRLQRQFDACVGEVLALEESKTRRASVMAYSIGLAGTALLAGAVFAYLAGMVPLMVILAIPGFAGWALPYLLYTGISRRKVAEVTPLIEAKYDEMYSVCEKASGLLARG